MSVFIVYKTDVHHSYNSREIIGIATTEENAITLCETRATKEGERISDWQLWHLNDIKQTQDYSGPGEFQYEKIETDRLL